MAKPSEDTKLEVLNDHYKETVSDFKKTGKSRDINFVAVLLLLGIMAFQFVSPDQSQSILTQVVNSRLNIDSTLSVNLLGILVWLSLLFATIRYFQTVLNLEKQYNYSHELEEQLSKSYGGKAFTREGKSYLKDYPVFSLWIHFVYRKLFPLILAIVLSVKIIGEWMASKTSALQLALDSVLYLALMVSIVLYAYSLHKTEKHTEKDVTN